MSRFDTYFLMKTPDVLEYVKEKGYMPADAQLTADVQKLLALSGGN